MSLAIFDLDNTLLNGDSDHAWGEFLCEKGIVDVEEYRQANNYFFQQYKSGTLDIFEFLSFALKPLTNNSVEQLKIWRKEFMTEKVAPMMLTKAATLLQKHRDQGDYLLIITATNRFVTGPIAEQLGVDDILATEPEMIDERYTGNVAGTPCFQHGKVERLNSWLETRNYSLENSYFYSDSQNDLALLQLVDNPVAVDPDDSLKETAQNHGWPIISLR